VVYLVEMIENKGSFWNSPSELIEFDSLESAKDFILRHSDNDCFCSLWGTRGIKNKNFRRRKK